MQPPAVLIAADLLAVTLVGLSIRFVSWAEMPVTVGRSSPVGLGTRRRRPGRGQARTGADRRDRRDRQLATHVRLGVSHHGVDPASLAGVDVRVTLTWQPLGAVSLDDGGRLLFPQVQTEPGLYRLDLLPLVQPSPARVYVGETDSLRRRLTRNYRSPGPTQHTSLRVNELLREHLSRGGQIHLAIATTAIAYLAGVRQPLDMTIKASRLLAENAALVAMRVAANAEIMNKP